MIGGKNPIFLFETLFKMQSIKHNSPQYFPNVEHISLQFYIKLTNKYTDTVYTHAPFLNAPFREYPLNLNVKLNLKVNLYQWCNCAIDAYSICFIKSLI